MIFCRNNRSIGPSLPPDFKNQSNADVFLKSNEDIPVKPARLFGPSRPPTEKESQRERIVKNRSRSPTPSSNSAKNNLVREPWMSKISDKPAMFKPSTFETIEIINIMGFDILDPLNIKSRTFIQKRTGSNASFDKDQSVDLDIKTETDELLIDEQIREFNEEHRQKTLQEIYEAEHMGKKKIQTEIDIKERIFDWERDMNSNVRQMSSKSAKDLVNKSKLYDRFGSSSSKKYL